MTQQEYEQIKLDCKKELRNELLMGELQGDLFSLAFDRAYALGKQEKDADTVIQGWVCRDKEWDKDIFPSDLFLAMEKPKRDGENGMWYDLGKYIPLNTELFPDLTWESDSEPVEIIIKRKKNG